MKNEALNAVFEGLDRGETPDVFAMLAALSNISELVTPDDTPATSQTCPSQPVYGVHCPSCGL